MSNPVSFYRQSISMRRSVKKIAVLYEDTCQGKKTKRYKGDHDASNYHVDETPPTTWDFKQYLRFYKTIIKKALNPTVKHVIQRYLKRWALWQFTGLMDTPLLLVSIKHHLNEFYEILQPKTEVSDLNLIALAR